MCALFSWGNLQEKDTGTDGMILNERKWLQSRTVLACFHNNSPRNTVNLVTSNKYIGLHVKCLFLSNCNPH